VYELPHRVSFSLRHPSSSLQYKQENRRGELLSCAEVSASISSSLAGASSSDIQDTIHPTNPSGRHRSNSAFEFRTQTWPTSLVRAQRCDSHSFFLCNKWCVSLLGLFVKSRKAQWAPSCGLHSFARPQLSTLLPMGGFSLNFILGHFIKIRRQISILFQIGQKNQALYVKAQVLLLLLTDMGSSEIQKRRIHCFKMVQDCRVETQLLRQWSIYY